jgi:hypothetical protein
MLLKCTISTKHELKHPPPDTTLTNELLPYSDSYLDGSYLHLAAQLAITSLVMAQQDTDCLSGIIKAIKTGLGIGTYFHHWI